jgi:hypothetical protein
MSPKTQNQPQNLKISGEPITRFNRVLVIDASDVDFFSEATLLKNIAISKKIDREVSVSAALDNISKTGNSTELPELIFLGINGEADEAFHFLENFSLLPKTFRSKCKIVVMSNSSDKEEKYRILLNPNVIRFFSKPLDAYQLKDFVINL